ncbi:MAG: M16 family metallopeptidase, partial [Pyrinomonadaceae bacterium]
MLAMLETVSTAISNPAIDRDTTLRLRTALLSRLTTLETDPGYVADRAAAARLFGTFPYGRPQLGTPASVAKVDFADLLDAKQRFLTADNATIALSGNFDRELAFRAIRRYFGGWIKADKRIPSTFRQPDPPPAGVLSIPSPKADSAAIRFVTRGVSRGDKDLAAARVYWAIIQNRLKARVPLSPASDVFVHNDFRTLPGLVTIGFSVNNAGAASGKLQANDLFGKVMIEPITEWEVQAAKTAVHDEWAKIDVVTFWLDAETYKLSDPAAEARIHNNVSLADVTAFAEKVRKQPLVTVVVNNTRAAN